MARYAVFAFREEPACLLHALLYVRDFTERGHQAVLILEGPATATAAAAYRAEAHQLHGVYTRALESGLIGGFCSACARQSGAFDELTEQGLPALNEMLGHPSPARFRDTGWEVLIL